LDITIYTLTIWLLIPICDLNPHESLLHGDRYDIHIDGPGSWNWSGTCEAASDLQNNWVLLNLENFSGYKFRWQNSKIPTELGRSQISDGLIGIQRNHHETDTIE
jgi:hypothetical protein